MSLAQNKFVFTATSTVLLTVVGASSAPAAIVTGTFVDPLIPSLYPASTLTGNFSFDSASVNAQGFVSSNDISFSSLETTNNAEGFNGTGWSFIIFPVLGGGVTSFVFNMQSNLFEGTYALERACFPSEGCPPGTLGQTISPPEGAIWDSAPNQTVVITSNRAVSEPSSWAGLLLSGVIGVGYWSKRRKQVSAPTGSSYKG